MNPREVRLVHIIYFCSGAGLENGSEAHEIISTWTRDEEKPR